MNIVEFCWEIIKAYIELVTSVIGAVVTTILLLNAGFTPAFIYFVCHMTVVMLFFALAGEMVDGGGIGTMTRRPPPGTPILVVANSTGTLRGNSRRSSAIWF